MVEETLTVLSKRCGTADNECGGIGTLSRTLRFPDRLVAQAKVLRCRRLIEKTGYVCNKGKRNGRRLLKCDVARNLMAKHT